MKTPLPTKKLGEICEIVPGQAPPSRFYNSEGLGMPFLTVNSFGNVYPKIERWTTKCLRKSSKKDVLFSVAGSLGLVNLGIDACITRSIFALRPKENILLQKFLFYTLKKYDSIIASLGSGTAQKVITIQQIKNFQIPLPPLSIQQKIVSILDTIQEAVDLQEKIIEKTKELKKSMMAEIFNSKVKSQKSKLKFKIQKWEKLGRICNLRKEQVMPKQEDKYIGLENIEPGETTIKKFASGSDVKSLKIKFYPQDILYGKLRPYLDKAVVVDFEGVCSTDLLVLRCNNKVLPKYLIYILHLPQFINFAVNTMSGTNHPRTSWSSLKNFLIPLPQLSEQQEIAGILQTIDEKIEIEQKKKALYEELFRVMLNKIMKGEIKVDNLNF